MSPRSVSHLVGESPLLCNALPHLQINAHMQGHHATGFGPQQSLNSPTYCLRAHTAPIPDLHPFECTLAHVKKCGVCKMSLSFCEKHVGVKVCKSSCACMYTCTCSNVHFTQSSHLLEYRPPCKHRITLILCNLSLDSGRLRAIMSLARFT